MIKEKIITIVSLFFLFISFIGVIILQHKKIDALQEDWSIAVMNSKAFFAENDSLRMNSLAFKLTIDQLEYFNDSLNRKLNDTRKELRIKDKDLEQMQIILSEAKKTDTIILRDTIFINESVKVDTLLGDEWYQLRLGLEYPNKIMTSPAFKSEKYVIVSTKKETIKPPKKCVIARWFQKKHKVVEVKVIEKNPYIENGQQRFIEIIK